jgi:hypothetical protein
MFAPRIFSDLLRQYRATGADLPFGNRELAHDVAVEGHYWNLTDVRAGRTVIAFAGINASAEGHWANLGLAASNGFIRTLDFPTASADPERFGVRAGTAFRADEGHLHVDLGPDARLDLRIDDLIRIPQARCGGISRGQTIPGLSQYWHPWLLGGRATGVVRIGSEEWTFDGAEVYSEKNWSTEGFPEVWWWGQAQGFDGGYSESVSSRRGEVAPGSGACVAFAGGMVTAGPLRKELTAIVVRLPDGRVLWFGNPVVSPVKTNIEPESWHLVGRSALWRVEIRAHAALDGAHVLPIPVPSARYEIAGAIEHLTGTLEVRVSRLGEPVWRGISYLAALENGGIPLAAAELRRRGAPPDATGAPPLCTRP